MVFEAGTLTGYTVDLEGDGLQIVSLPLKVLSGISTATGELFGLRSNRAHSEAAAINAELALQAMRANQTRCQRAIVADDLESIRQFCGR